jgi:UPF0755 protein
MRSLPNLFFIVLLSVIMLLTIHVYLFLRTAVSPGKAIRLDIASGMSAWEISQALEKNQIITDAPMFMTIALITKKARNLQAGTYVFEGRHYPLEIMDTLYKGRSLKYRITIPEGYDIYEIDKALSTMGMIARDEFIKIAGTKDTARFFSLNAPNMEGFMYPDTYLLGPHMTSREIIARMYRRFRQIYTPEMRQRARKVGLTDLEVITLASIIEKEAISPAEKPIISSVFHNRLRQGMKLQSDPTAIYGIKGFRRDITPEDLKRDTPYNTYLYKGLPLGPICNPGKDSLMAALWPTETRHLYFVSKGDGHHFFSTSFKEHNEAILKSKMMQK